MYCLWRSSYQEGVVVIPLTGLALPCFCACTKLIPVEYILPSLFKVLSCAKTTVGQMKQEPRNILTSDGNIYSTGINLVQAQKHGRAKPVNGITTTPS
jgi:hypothetical protein